MSAATVEAPPKGPDEEGAEAAGRYRGRGRAGWFVRITIIVIVILWSIPTLGVLITSLRPESLTVNTTGWWTVLAHPFRPPSGRSRTTASRSTQGSSGTRS